MFFSGPHVINVTYDGIPVPGSPFNVGVVNGCDPSRVKVFGPGESKGLSDCNIFGPGKSESLFTRNILFRMFDSCRIQLCKNEL